MNSTGKHSKPKSPDPHYKHNIWAEIRFFKGKVEEGQEFLISAMKRARDANDSDALVKVEQLWNEIFSANKTSLISRLNDMFDDYCKDWFFNGKPPEGV